MTTPKSAVPDSGPMTRLLAALCQLPGINAQTALRIAAHLAEDIPERQQLPNLMDAARESGLCPVCAGLSDKRDTPCAICADDSRPRDTLCVVEQPADLASIERSGAYGGRYHVIDRLLSAKGDTDVENTNVPQLVQRVKEAEGEIEEVIVATDPSPDGDYTAEYVAQALGHLPSPPRVTRPAIGLPSGTGPEFVDEATVRKSIQERRPA